MKISTLSFRLLPFFTLGGFFIARTAQAVCPVCVVAVGAGLGLSEYLGIDDTVAGLWLGGLIVAIIAWTINWFNKKGWKFGHKNLRDILTTIIYYLLIIWPLMAQDFIGQIGNSLWGIDKLLLGITVGSLVFLAAAMWYNHIKKRRGRPCFPYQKIAMPVSALLVFSFLFYFLTR